MKTLRVIVLLSVVALFLSACWEDKHFYVKDADISIDIERLGTERFRIYVYRNEEDRGKDYMDINYDMSDIHSVQLCIPRDEDFKIFVIDRWHDLYKISSSVFIFDVLSPEGATNRQMITLDELNSLNATLAKIDSVMDSIPSVTIQLNPRLSDLFVWKNGRYKSKRKVYPIDEKE